MFKRKQKEMNRLQPILTFQNRHILKGYFIAGKQKGIHKALENNGGKSIAVNQYILGTQNMYGSSDFLLHNPKFNQTSIY